MARNILWQLWVAWDFSSYTDETAYLISANGSMKLAPPESSITSPRGIVDQCTLVLDNTSGRYSPLNSSGALYADIAGGGAYHAPMYLLVSIDNAASYSRVFTGVLKIPRETGSTARQNATATFDCRSRDEVLLNKRVSTTNADFRTSYDANWTEEDYMRAWLTDAGLVETTDFVLDRGTFVIPWAWLDDESPLEEIWLLAAACGGRFYCDPAGIFRYENMAHWLMPPHDTSQETLDTGDFAQMEPRYEDKELYSTVTVETSERALVQVGVIWQADDVVTVPADNVITVTAKLRQPAYSIDDVTYSAVTGGMKRINSDIAITVTKYAARAELEITNANVTFAANLTTLSLTGGAVDGRPGSENIKTSAQSFWDARQGRTRALRSNPYIQSASQAEVLARFLRNRYELPRLFFTLSGAPGKPGRRLGDRITVNDTSVMSSASEAFLLEIRWRLNNQGFSQDLVCMSATDLFPDEATGYFILGTSTMDSDAVLFY